MVTARLELSKGTPDDAIALFPYVHGDEGRRVTDTLLWDGPDVVEDMTSFYELHETRTFAEHGFHWILRDRTGQLTNEGGTPLGSIGLEPGKDDEDCEIGYWLAPPYWGQGLMAEAIVAVAEMAFSQGYRAVRAYVYVQNVRNQKLLEKLGFSQAELVENYVVKRGVKTDAFLYFVTEAELTHPT